MSYLEECTIVHSYGREVKLLVVLTYPGNIRQSFQDAQPQQEENRKQRVRK